MAVKINASNKHKLKEDNKTQFLHEYEILGYNTLLFKENLFLLKDTPFLVLNFNQPQGQYEHNVINICLNRSVWAIGIRHFCFVSKKS